MRVIILVAIIESNGNGFALWLTLMIVLTGINYGYPIVQLLALKGNAVPAVYMGAGK